MIVAMIVIGSVLVFCLIVFLVVSFIVYRMAFWNERKHDDISHEVMTGEQYDPYRETMIRSIDAAHAIRPSEEIRIKSFDGGQLYARYYQMKPGAPVCILFHGYKGEGVRDFAGGLKMTTDAGYNVILVDERGHRNSCGSTISFGIKERRDVASWVSYVSERFGSETPIFLVGISMGAATVLMASDMDLKGNVRGIFADCPYSTPEEIILNTAKNMKINLTVTKPFLYSAAWIFGHFHLRETDPVRAVKNARCPILIIHGEDDRFVPAEMSERIAKENPDKIERITFPNAAHGMSYILDSDRYRNTIVRFLETHVA